MFMKHLRLQRLNEVRQSWLPCWKGKRFPPPPAQHSSLPTLKLLQSEKTLRNFIWRKTNFFTSIDDIWGVSIMNKGCPSMTSSFSVTWFDVERSENLKIGRIQKSCLQQRSQSKYTPKTCGTMILYSCNSNFPAFNCCSLMNLAEENLHTSLHSTCWPDRESREFLKSEGGGLFIFFKKTLLFPPPHSPPPWI